MDINIHRSRVVCRVAYWGAKSAIFKSVKKYANNLGEVVLDPYGGAGGIVAELLKLGKRVIYNDINPVARLIARYNVAVTEDDKRELKRCLKTFREVLTPLRALYTAHCPVCRETREIRFIIHDGSSRAYLSCGHEVEVSDFKIKPPPWARIRLSYGEKRFLKTGGELAIADVVTPRGIVIFSALRRVLRNCGEVAKYSLLPSVYLATKMAFLPEEKTRLILSGKNWTPSWALPAYWLPKRYVEYNLVEVVLSRAEKIARCRAKRYKIGSAEDVFANRAQVAFLSNDVTELPLPDGSVDIITDPPYPTDVQYGELFFLHAKVLDIPYNVFDKELVVNRNRGTTFDTYLAIFDNHLKILSRKSKKYAIFILKKGNYTEKIIDLINRHFVVEQTEDITTAKRRSRIGDFRPKYTYTLVVARK